MPARKVPTKKEIETKRNEKKLICKGLRAYGKTFEEIVNITGVPDKTVRRWCGEPVPIVEGVTLDPPTEEEPETVEEIQSEPMGLQEPERAATLEDAIREASTQIREQRAEMKRARAENDANAYNRAARLVISASGLLGRLCSKEDRGGIYVTAEELTAARRDFAEKLGNYVKRAMGGGT